MKPVEKRKATGKLAELIEEFNDLPCEEKIHRISDTRVEMEKEVWLKKACEWLEKLDIIKYSQMSLEYLANDFRKAMEE